MTKNIKGNFGNKEVISIVLGIVGCAIFGVCVSRLSTTSELINALFGCTWLTLFASLFGPVPGLIVGFVGAQSICYFSGNSEWLILALGVSCYGFFIGRYKEKYGILEGRFNKKTVALFFMTQTFASICYYSIFYPLFKIFVYKGFIYDEIRRGTMYSLCIIVCAQVILIPFFFFLSKFLKKRSA